MKGLMRLFVKDCALPIRIQKLEALEGRIPTNDPIWPEIVKEYKSRMAGYRGEKSLKFHLSMLSDTNYQIYHNIRLLYRGYYFQIDFLVLCPRFTLVLEVKNIARDLFFKKEFNQVTWIQNGEEERIKNPVLQAKLQAKKLKGWLREQIGKEIPIPIYYFFVNTNERSKVVIEARNEQIKQHICNSEMLIEKIEQLENYSQNETFDGKEIKKVKRLLLTKNTPDNPDILKHFDLSPNKILSGVKCPTCRFLPMIYVSGTWNCPNCKMKSKTAHQQTINDYFLIINPHITNAELREFLHIDSIRVSGKILSSMNLPFSGGYKNRVYLQPPIQ